MLSAIVFLPLIGFLIAGLFGKLLGHRPVEILTTSLVGIAAVLSWIVFIETGFGDVHGERVQVLHGFHPVISPSIGRSASIR
jgi:NADH-quinone oxidoreductase subunit L